MTFSCRKLLTTATIPMAALLVATPPICSAQPSASRAAGHPEYPEPKELAIILAWHAVETQLAEQRAEAGSPDPAAHQNDVKRRKSEFAAKHGITIAELDSLLDDYDSWQNAVAREKRAEEEREASSSRWFFGTMSILLLANLPVYLVFGKTIFGGWPGFWGAWHNTLHARKGTKEGMFALNQFAIFAVAIGSVVAVEYWVLTRLTGCFH